jgi:hypothetical protein
MHDISIILTGKNESCAPHVRSELIYFIKLHIHYITTDHWISEISKNEIVRVGFSELRVLEVHTSHPPTFTLQPLNEVRSDEPTGS